MAVSTVTPFKTNQSYHPNIRGPWNMQCSLFSLCSCGDRTNESLLYNNGWLTGESPVFYSLSLPKGWAGMNSVNMLTDQSLNHHHWTTTLATTLRTKQCQTLLHVLCWIIQVWKTITCYSFVTDTWWHKHSKINALIHLIFSSINSTFVRML